MQMQNLTTSHQEPPQSQETESLVQRLAGPSSGKAGLAKDQTEINRIIADVSKGSKFYENEKKKDRELTERINKVLKTRDEVVKGVDIRKVEANVDRLLAEMESQRDLTQTIVHVDMDAFYASVELLSNPELAGKPFGVGRGVLTTASYEARKYGVRSGMPGFIAKRLCPDLIFVQNHFSKYMDMSNRIMAIFKRYDPNMLPAGCDEGYLNITAYCEEHSISAEDCVREMRRIVFEETKLTVSAGIAPNKMLAKICSDRNKPNGQFHLPFDRKSIVAFMHDLSIRKVPGIGRVNERLLESIGIKTCADIFTHRVVIALMDKQFGLHFLLRTHLGIASNEVQPIQREERKSIGAERTFPPLDDRDKLLQMLEHIASELESDMSRNGWMGKTVTLKYKLDTYQVFTRAKSLTRYVSSKQELFSIGRDLFVAEGHVKVRLIGLRVTRLKDLRAPSPAGIKRFFESANSSPRKRQKLGSEGMRDEIYENDEQEKQHMDAMPGFYEHEEAMHHVNAVEESEDDQRGMVAEKSRERPRPPVSAPARPLTSLVKLEDVPRKISPPKPKPLGRERSKSDVGQRSKDPYFDVPNGKQAQVCPICSRTLVTDNQGLNAHVDFCLSRSAIQEARSNGGGTSADKSEHTASAKPPFGPTLNGWDFLMAQKETNPRTKDKKRK
ncbi:IMS-domain-containing protein [Macrolepiota fuliginosa MF-IS2]|uniref:DNA polymerase kappa n=1 Tax=Macrolepiota fuliginosa MF-IS2 TaxID=1400762 RepID=A0A9P5XL43_9AGAR|nr:IMS-domain-containing protein [Macrolepiota fuliginosa MF-IS2]